MTRPESPYPSVTTVLSPFTDFSKVPEDTLAAAADRGSRAHRLCYLHATNTPIMMDIDEDVAGFFESFRRWFDRFVVSVVAAEVELVDPAIGFCGHPDLICMITGDKRPAVVDYKTPATEAPTWRGQMAAYRRLAQQAGYDVGRAFSLRLFRDGREARVAKEYTEAGRDLAAFMAALTAYAYFKK